ncbi:glycoside hydrolase family 13 protein [Nocardioides bigeumensis]|uniref:Glycoside hydrolase family 13 protein n=1 Tax=Nocardioides bigeumensis TaxID=433657 RepID=A0ABN2YQ57_9ACTN
MFYQVYVRSFADSDGDGIGDLPGITSRLPHLAELGVDGLWITPFYTSPQHDHGYDVADYCDVDPLFGQLADADALIARAHELGLKVVFDIVPNHTSSEHAWFKAALAAEPGSPERDRYLFRTGKGENGEEPPNNWDSVFGGAAWDRIEGTDQWYLHLFDRTQPDLNWRNPEVPAMFEAVLRFWLDRGVDGFRVDVAHSLYKESLLRDQVKEPDDDGKRRSAVAGEGGMVEVKAKDEPMWDQPEVHDVYRAWRKILDSYEPARMSVAEAWTQTPESTARYVRPDELHQAFNFAWLLAPWSAAAFKEVIDSTLSAIELVDSSPTWVLSNHDVTRHVTRYGGGPVGLARARATTLTMLALPGSSYLYQGEELGLPEADVAPEFRQDPSWFRTGEIGRDGCRVPIPWGGDAPPYDFGPGTGHPWIPQPEEYGELTVEKQAADPSSTLAFYRATLAARRDLVAAAGDAIDAVEVTGDVLTFERGPVTVVVNCGKKPLDLPDGEVVVSSAALVGGKLPVDSAAWVRTG